jgi:hypothetical protein
MYASVEYIYYIILHNGVHNLVIYIWWVEFKIVMLEASHKYNLYDITIEFKIVILATYHKFHIQFIFYH